MSYTPSAATARPITTAIRRQFRKFTPTCDTNEIQTCTQEQLVNTYDNTLVYVDYIVDKAINLLKEHQDKFTTSRFIFLTTVNR